MNVQWRVGFVVIEATSLIFGLISVPIGSAAGLPPAAVQATAVTGAVARTTMPATPNTRASAPPAASGSPPSGEVPILFNDHHVSAAPTSLRGSRVLSALVRGNTVLLPLRSMFEQMGATVSYDPATQTASASKTGVEVRITVGRSEVVINGQSRPLDVPAETKGGVMLVPIRVLSESLGAYVQWVPEQRSVVVRYLTAVPTAPPIPVATPTPTTMVTPAPVATPPQTPTPTTAPTLSEHYITGNYGLHTTTYNEFAPGTARDPLWLPLALEFKVAHVPMLFRGDFRQYKWTHTATPLANGETPPCFINPNNRPPGYTVDPAHIPPPAPPSGNPSCVTAVGGTFQTFVPSFTGRERDLNISLGLQIAKPSIYANIAYIGRDTNYGYPRQYGIGIGIDKLADLNRPISLYGSMYFYPSTRGAVNEFMPGQFPGTVTVQTLTISSAIYKYQIGAAVPIPGLPLFLDLGFAGDRGLQRVNSPSSFTHSSTYAGVGIRFPHIHIGSLTL